MKDNDAFRLFDRDVAVFWICVLLGMIAVFVPAHAKAGEWRGEMYAGYCKHSLAPDASWHYGYGGYRTNMTLRPACFNFAAVRMIDRTFGLRAAYVDLGHVDADNTYPVDDLAYFAAKATNTPVASPTARFQGQGVSRGFSFGPLVSWRLLEAEAGIAALYNNWHVDSWRYADGWNTTWYAGAAFKWRYLRIGVRRYENVHASQSKTNYQFIGPTSGQVIQTTFGISIPL